MFCQSAPRNHLIAISIQTGNRKLGASELVSRGDEDVHSFFVAVLAFEKPIGTLFKMLFLILPLYHSPTTIRTVNSFVRASTDVRVEIPELSVPRTAIGRV